MEEKGALAGGIYESFNYISQTEFQLEEKKKKERKDVQLKSKVINLWLRIMVNKVAVHHSITRTLLFLDVYSSSLPLPPKAKCS